MPNRNDAQVNAPDDHAEPKLQSTGLPPTDPTDQVASDEKDGQLRKSNVEIGQRSLFHVHVERVAQQVLRKLLDGGEGVGLAIVDHQPSEMRPQKVD